MFEDLPTLIALCSWDLPLPKKPAHWNMPHKAHAAFTLCTDACSVPTREVAVHGLKHERGLKEVAFRFGFLTYFLGVGPTPQGKPLIYRESTDPDLCLQP